MSKQNGFIILVTLIFLLIFTLWSLNAIANLGEMSTVNQVALTRLRFIHEGLKILTALETKIQNHETLCQAETIDQRCGANLADFSYDYRLEFLGSDICTFIEKSVHNAVFYRIKLKLIANERNQLSVQLETIGVKKGAVAGCQCHRTPRNVAPGRQIWFEI